MNVQQFNYEHARILRATRMLEKLRNASYLNAHCESPQTKRAYTLALRALQRHLARMLDKHLKR